MYTNQSSNFREPMIYYDRQSGGPFLKILEFCRSDGVGGLEIYVQQATQQLTERGHEVFVVTARGTMLDASLERDGIPREHVEMRSRSFPFVAARQLARIIDREAIDVVHVHWRNDVDAAVWARRFSRRRPAVVSMRKMLITRPKHDPYHRLIFGGVDLWIAVSNSLADALREALTVPPDRITTLYTGLPAHEPAPPEEREAFIAEHRIPEAALKIAVFSRIQHIKGQHVVVDALAKLRDRGTDAMVVFAGHVMDNDYMAKLEKQIADLGLEQNVQFAGFIEGPARFLSLFDVLVLPTYGETFPRTIIEAMRAGIAVIGTNDGGVPEMLCEGEIGLLFEPGDAQGLADALQRLASDPVFRKTLAGKGQAYAAEAFDEARHFDGLVRMFEATVDRVRRGETPTGPA